MTQEPQQDSLATRRGVLAGVGLVGLAGALAGCGSSGSSSAAAATSPTTGGGGSMTSAAASGSAAASEKTGGVAAGALAATSDIPVGGGKIFDAHLIVVTQPSAGEYKAFSAVCTHMGCTVNHIANGRIDCPCHGSQYSIKTGAVLAGPAPKPLPAKHIKITGDSIFLA